MTQEPANIISNQHKKCYYCIIFLNLTFLSMQRQTYHIILQASVFYVPVRTLTKQFKGSYQAQHRH